LGAGSATGGSNSHSTKRRREIRTFKFDKEPTLSRKSSQKEMSQFKLLREVDKKESIAKPYREIASEQKKASRPGQNEYGISTFNENENPSYR